MSITQIPFAEGEARLDWLGLTEALALAEDIAGKSPSAIRAAKRLIEVAESKSRAEVLLEESAEQVELIGKPDQIEVIAAQMQGRKPEFK